MLRVFSVTLLKHKYSQLFILFTRKVHHPFVFPNYIIFLVRQKMYPRNTTTVIVMNTRVF